MRSSICVEPSRPISCLARSPTRATSTSSAFRRSGSADARRSQLTPPTTGPGRAVVTGGAGFIGSHMVDLLLEQGWRVTVLDNLTTGRLDNLRQHQNEPRLDVLEMDLRELTPA